LMRILHNLHVTGATRESRQPMAIEEEALERVPGRTVGSLRAPSFTPDEMDQELVWAIDALPESYRAVLLLWAVEEKSYAEIAAALSLPPGTVMSRLHRARKRICDQLGREALGTKYAS
jgi:RNA polymerase sigma-70 factor (ECF subfamily)